MADAAVSIKLLADISDATKSINSFSKTADLALKAGFAFLLGSGLKNAFGVVIGSAEESEKAITKMEVALKLAGDFSVEAAEGFEEFASQIQSVTTFSDEAALSSVALAKQFNTTNEEAKRLVEAAADLASITGEDLETATRKLGQTLDGTAGRLAEQVPALKNLTAEQLKAGAAIDIVAQRFAGAGAALGQTFAGQIIQARNAFDDILESLGKFVTQNNFVLEGISALKTLFIEINKIILDNKEVIIAFIKGGIVFLLDAVDIAIKTFIGWDVILTKIGQTFLQLRRIISTTEFKDIIDKRIAASESSLNSRIKFYSDLTDSIKKFSDTVEEAGTQQVQSAKKASAALENQQKALEKLTDTQIKALVANPFATVTDSRGGRISGFGVGQSPFNAKQESVVAGGLGAFGTALLGEKGAIKLAGEFASAIGTAFLGPVGQALGPIIETLAQGPEKVREMLTSFLEAIPTIIENIIESIPEVILVVIQKLPEIIDSFIERLPEIIQAFVSKIPEIATALANQAPFIAIRFSIALAAQMPKIAISFVDALVKEAPRFVNELIKSINPFQSGGGAAGSFLGGVGDFFGGIGDIFGFAEGGLIPPGFPNDTFPMRASSGELVIDRSTTQKLNSFLDNGGGGQEQPAIINIQIGETELAQVLLNLNRNGFRTA